MLHVKRQWQLRVVGTGSAEAACKTSLIFIRGLAVLPGVHGVAVTASLIRQAR